MPTGVEHNPTTTTTACHFSPDTLNTNTSTSIKTDADSPRHIPRAKAISLHKKQKALEQMTCRKHADHESDNCRKLKPASDRTPEYAGNNTTTRDSSSDNGNTDIDNNPASGNATGAAYHPPGNFRTINKAAAGLTGIVGNLLVNADQLTDPVGCCITVTQQGACLLSAIAGPDHPWLKKGAQCTATLSTGATVALSAGAAIQTGNPSLMVMLGGKALMDLGCRLGIHQALHWLCSWSPGMVCNYLEDWLQAAVSIALSAGLPSLQRTPEGNLEYHGLLVSGTISPDTSTARIADYGVITIHGREVGPNLAPPEAGQLATRAQYSQRQFETGARTFTDNQRYCLADKDDLQCFNKMLVFAHVSAMGSSAGSGTGLNLSGNPLATGPGSLVPGSHWPPVGRNRDLPEVAEEDVYFDALDHVPETEVYFDAPDDPAAWTEGEITSQGPGRDIDDSSSRPNHTWPTLPPVSSDTSRAADIGTSSLVTRLQQGMDYLWNLLPADPLVLPVAGAVPIPGTRTAEAVDRPASLPVSPELIVTLPPSISDNRVTPPVNTSDNRVTPEPTIPQASPDELTSTFLHHPAWHLPPYDPDNPDITVSEQEYEYSRLVVSLLQLQLTDLPDYPSPIDLVPVADPGPDNSTVIEYHPVVLKNIATAEEINLLAKPDPNLPPETGVSRARWLADTPYHPALLNRMLYPNEFTPDAPPSNVTLNQMINSFYRFLPGHGMQLVQPILTYQEVITGQPHTHTRNECQQVLARLKEQGVTTLSVPVLAEQPRETAFHLQWQAQQEQPADDIDQPGNRTRSNTDPMANAWPGHHLKGAPTSDRPGRPAALPVTRWHTMPLAGMTGEQITLLTETVPGLREASVYRSLAAFTPVIDQIRQNPSMLSYVNDVTTVTVLTRDLYNYQGLLPDFHRALAIVLGSNKGSAPIPPSMVPLLMPEYSQICFQHRRFVPLLPTEDIEHYMQYLGEITGLPGLKRDDIIWLLDSHNGLDLLIPYRLDEVISGAVSGYRGGQLILPLSLEGFRQAWVAGNVTEQVRAAAQTIANSPAGPMIRTLVNHYPDRVSAINRAVASLVDYIPTINGLHDQLKATLHTRQVFTPPLVPDSTEHQQLRQFMDEYQQLGSQWYRPATLLLTKRELKHYSLMLRPEKASEGLGQLQLTDILWLKYDYQGLTLVIPLPLSAVLSGAFAGLDPRLFILPKVLEPLRNLLAHHQFPALMSLASQDLGQDTNIGELRRYLDQRFAGWQDDNPASMPGTGTANTTSPMTEPFPLAPGAETTATDWQSTSAKAQLSLVPEIIKDHKGFLPSINQAIRKQVGVIDGTSGTLTPLTDTSAIYREVRTAFRSLDWGWSVISRDHTKDQLIHRLIAECKTLARQLHKTVSLRPIEELLPYLPLLGKQASHVDPQLSDIILLMFNYQGLMLPVPYTLHEVLSRALSGEDWRQLILPTHLNPLIRERMVDQHFPEFMSEAYQNLGPETRCQAFNQYLDLYQTGCQSERDQHRPQQGVSDKKLRAFTALLQSESLAREEDRELELDDKIYARVVRSDHDIPGNITLSPDVQTRVTLFPGFTLEEVLLGALQGYQPGQLLLPPPLEPHRPLLTGPDFMTHLKQGYLPTSDLPEGLSLIPELIYNQKAFVHSFNQFIVSQLRNYGWSFVGQPDTTAEAGENMIYDKIRQLLSLLNWDKVAAGHSKDALIKRFMEDYFKLIGHLYQPVPLHPYETLIRYPRLLEPGGGDLRLSTMILLKLDYQGLVIVVPCSLEQALSGALSGYDENQLIIPRQLLSSIRPRLVEQNFPLFMSEAYQHLGPDAGANELSTYLAIYHLGCRAESKQHRPEAQGISDEQLVKGAKLVQASALEKGYTELPLTAEIPVKVTRFAHDIAPGIATLPYAPDKVTLLPVYTFKQVLLGAFQGYNPGQLLLPLQLEQHRLLLTSPDFVTCLQQGYLPTTDTPEGITLIPEIVYNHKGFVNSTNQAITRQFSDLDADDTRATKDVYDGSAPAVYRKMKQALGTLDWGEIVAATGQTKEQLIERWMEEYLKLTDFLLDKVPLLSAEKLTPYLPLLQDSRRVDLQPSDNILLKHSFHGLELLLPLSLQALLSGALAGYRHPHIILPSWMNQRIKGKMAEPNFLKFMEEAHKNLDPDASIQEIHRYMRLVHIGEEQEIRKNRYQQKNLSEAKLRIYSTVLQSLSLATGYPALQSDDKIQVIVRQRDGDIRSSVDTSPNTQTWVTLFPGYTFAQVLGGACRRYKPEQLLLPPPLEPYRHLLTQPDLPEYLHQGYLAHCSKDTMPFSQAPQQALEDCGYYQQPLAQNTFMSSIFNEVVDGVVYEVVNGIITYDPELLTTVIERVGSKAGTRIYDDGQMSNYLAEYVTQCALQKNKLLADARSFTLRSAKDQQGMLEAVQDDSGETLGPDDRILVIQTTREGLRLLVPITLTEALQGALSGLDSERVLASPAIRKILKPLIRNNAGDLIHSIYRSTVLTDILEPIAEDLNTVLYPMLFLEETFRDKAAEAGVQGMNLNDVVADYTRDSQTKGSLSVEKDTIPYSFFDFIMNTGGSLLPNDTLAIRRKLNTRPRWEDDKNVQQLIDLLIELDIEQLYRSTCKVAKTGEFKSTVGQLLAKNLEFYPPGFKEKDEHQIIFGTRDSYGTMLSKALTHHPFVTAGYQGRDQQGQPNPDSPIILYSYLTGQQFKVGKLAEFNSKIDDSTSELYQWLKYQGGGGSMVHYFENYDVQFRPFQMKNVLAGRDGHRDWSALGAGGGGAWGALDAPPPWIHTEIRKNFGLTRKEFMNKALPTALLVAYAVMDYHHRSGKEVSIEKVFELTSELLGVIGMVPIVGDALDIVGTALLTEVQILIEDENLRKKSLRLQSYLTYSVGAGVALLPGMSMAAGKKLFRVVNDKLGDVRKKGTKKTGIDHILNNGQPNRVRKPGTHGVPDPKRRTMVDGKSNRELGTDGNPKRQEPEPDSFASQHCSPLQSTGRVRRAPPRKVHRCPAEKEKELFTTPKNLKFITQSESGNQLTLYYNSGDVSNIGGGSLSINDPSVGDEAINYEYYPYQINAFFYSKEHAEKFAEDVAAMKTPIDEKGLPGRVRYLLARSESRGLPGPIEGSYHVSVGFGRSHRRDTRWNHIKNVSFKGNRVTASHRDIPIPVEKPFELPEQGQQPRTSAGSDKASPVISLESYRAKGADIYSQLKDLKGMKKNVGQITVAPPPAPNINDVISQRTSNLIGKWDRLKATIPRSKTMFGYNCDNRIETFRKELELINQKLQIKKTDTNADLAGINYQQQVISRLQREIDFVRADQIINEGNLKYIIEQEGGNKMLVYKHNSASWRNNKPVVQQKTAVLKIDNADKALPESPLSINLNIKECVFRDERLAIEFTTQLNNIIDTLRKQGKSLTTQGLSEFTTNFHKKFPFEMTPMVFGKGRPIIKPNDVRVEIKLRELRTFPATRELEVQNAEISEGRIIGWSKIPKKSDVVYENARALYDKYQKNTARIYDQLKNDSKIEDAKRNFRYTDVSDGPGPVDPGDIPGTSGASGPGDTGAGNPGADTNKGPGGDGTDTDMQPAPPLEERSEPVPESFKKDSRTKRYKRLIEMVDSFRSQKPAADSNRPDTAPRVPWAPGGNQQTYDFSDSARRLEETFNPPQPKLLRFSSPGADDGGARKSVIQEADKSDPGDINIDPGDINIDPGDINIDPYMQKQITARTNAHKTKFYELESLFSDEYDLLYSQYKYKRIPAEYLEKNPKATFTQWRLAQLEKLRATLEHMNTEEEVYKKFLLTMDRDGINQLQDKSLRIGSDMRLEKIKSYQKELDDTGKP